MSGSLNSQPPEEADLNQIPGARALIGYLIEAGAPGDPVRVTLDIEAKHANRNGALHGGVIAMMLDAAGGFACSKHFGDGVAATPVVTLTLNTSFVAAAHIGDTVVATGEFTGGGSRIAYANVTMRNQTGSIVATAQGAFRTIRKKG